jgi:hypothetical protein
MAVCEDGPPSTETLNCALNCAGLPCATVTPGSNCARFKKLRPFSGRLSICCRVTTPCTVFDSKLIAAAVVPVTVMISVVCPICSEMFTVDVEPVCTCVGRRTVLKPLATTFTSYSPAGSEGAE